MTDARFPERWLLDRRFNRLSDREFRSFACALMWSVGNRTDGVIVPEDVPLIPWFSRESIDALVTAELWLVDDDGRDIRWRISEFENTQLSRSELEQLDNARVGARLKKRRQRARKKVRGAGMPPRLSPGTSPGTTQDRTGQDRPIAEPTT